MAAAARLARGLESGVVVAILPDGAERRVLRGDTSEEIPRLVATLRSTLRAERGKLAPLEFTAFARRDAAATQA